MSTSVVALSALLPGDVLVELPTLTIKNVDVLGPVVIVDFTDDTSTPPIPNGLVTIYKR